MIINCSTYHILDLYMDFMLESYTLNVTAISWPEGTKVERKE